MQKEHEKSRQFHGIPVWEITVFVAAVALVLLVFILWWFFGYSYVIAPSGGSSINLPTS